jgi:hypothetical protein
MTRRNRKISRPKRDVYSFVVDGECELWYLQRLKQHEKPNVKNINLEPKLPQKKKLKDQFDLVEELSKESEKVFWVIDFDVIYQETQNAKRGTKTALEEFKELCAKCEKNEKVIVVVNNPCLEYWFLQHFKQTSKFFATYAELEKPLKKHLTDYEKTEKYYKKSNGDIYKKLKDRLQAAIANSKRLGEFDFGNTATGKAEMYKIFDELEQ